MYKEIFTGPQVALAEMLDAREARSLRQSDLLHRYPQASLLSITMNIPGPIKTSEVLQGVFKAMLDMITQQLSAYTVQFNKCLDLKTGSEAYIVVDIAPHILKEQMVMLEQAQPLGRLMDLDVLALVEGQLITISRTQLNLPRRQCFICQEDAKLCGRARTHSVEEMQAAIAALIQDTQVG